MNKPIMYADPSGHFTIIVFIILFVVSASFEIIEDRVKIVVMEWSTIIELSNYKELVAKKGLYYNLNKTQFKR